MAVILRATAIDSQQALDHRVDPAEIATGQYFAGTVIMLCKGPQLDATNEESPMIGKILLTLAVVAIAYLIVRRDPGSNRGTTKPAPPEISAGHQKRLLDPTLHDDLRTASYLFLLFMVLVGAALYYFRWQDDHQLITVKLYSADQADPASYQVYKYQLAERSFTTVDGRAITVAGSDRMEVIGLND